MTNVTGWERVASVAAGAALLWLGTRRHATNRVASSTGAGLLARGLTGYCPVNAAVGRGAGRSHTADRSNTKVALGGDRGIHVHESVVIRRPASELFWFWRDLRNLPRFMDHLTDVAVLSPTRSVWTARAPMGMRVKWEAEIINEVEGELIGWRSTPNADVATAGSVRFVPIPGGATVIVVRLQYDPPAGKVGALVASMFGEEPSQQIRSDLNRLKEILEAGDAARTPDAAEQTGAAV